MYVFKQVLNLEIQKETELRIWLTGESKRTGGEEIETWAYFVIFKPFHYKDNIFTYQLQD